MTSVGDNVSVERQALEAQALRAMFDGFAVRGVSYAVLRNYEHLPDSIGARDIDILVAPADLGTASEIICDLACDLNLMFANFYRDERLVQFALVRRLDKGMLFDLKVDLFTSSQVYGVEAISASVMLEGARIHNGISVVADDVLLLDKWLFHLVVGQPVHTKYNAEFARIGTCIGQRLIGVLGPLVGRKKAVVLVAEVAAGRTSEITAFSGRDRCVLLARLWKRQGIAAIPRTLTFLGQRFRNRFRPHGIFLSVSGPDGSGKTTVIDHVIAELGQVYGGDNLECRHFRPTVLPRIAEVAKAAHAVETVDVDYGQPHRACPSGPAGSLARLGYYWLDYVGGYLRSVRPALVDRRVVLFDRYYYDMISDPGRSRIALPVGLLRVVARLLPLPRFGFFVRVSPEEVYRRKQELSLTRIRELNDRYGDLVRRGMLIAVDNEGRGPEEAAAQIVDTIIAQRDSRARQALGGLCR